LIATIYYLDWDQEGRDERYGPARELFDEANLGNTPDRFSADQFDDLYREVADVDVDGPEDAWRQWNAGSGYESEAFTKIQYCEQCDQYIDSRDSAVDHADREHDAEVYRPGDLPDYIHGERSMSVGDVIEIDDTYYVAAPIGFEELNIYTDEGDTSY